MNELASELTEIVANAARKLRSSPQAGSRSSLEPGVWSTKQVLGHLIDSAANNHARFVRAQIQDDLVFEGYAQEQWVVTQRYEEASWQDLVEFWRLYNLHLAHIIAHIPEDTLRRPRLPHSLDKIASNKVDAGEPATLAYLIEDYFGHLREHLAQLFNILEQEK